MKSLLSRVAFLLVLLVPIGAWSQVSIFISVAPPPLLIYDQPLVPGDGYIWMPGYWVWSPSDDDYYWVPGTWVLAPNVGELWTPGYWAFENSGYFWHRGYWSFSVGFYGGLNYGYGYTGTGYQGGRWNHGIFEYNRAASNVNTTVIHNVYNAPVLNRTRASHVSFNGGASGERARPTAPQIKMRNSEHTGPTAEQLQHERQALTTRTQKASYSREAPPIAATPKPSAFAAPGVEHTRTNTGPQKQSQQEPQQRIPLRTQQELPRRSQQAPQQKTQEAPQQRSEQVPQQRTQNQPQQRMQKEPQQQAPQQRPERALHQRIQNQPQQRNEQAPQQQTEQAPQQRSEREPQRSKNHGPDNRDEKSR